MDLTTLFKMSYGVYIVGSKADDKYSACIATTAMQVTSEEIPKLIAVINKENFTHELISKSKKVNISVLSQSADLNFIAKFGFQSGRDFDKLKDVNFEIGKNNIPVITENTIVYYEAKVINEIDVGTHTIFILLLENTKKVSDEQVLTYDYYHKVIKGGVPKTAATYVENNKNNNVNLEISENKKDLKINEKKGECKMNKYRCVICGYIYDEEKEGVKFEDLPDDWVCPLCKTGKENFKLVEE